MKIYYNATLICKSGDLDIKLFRIHSLRGVEIYQNLSFFARYLMGMLELRWELE